MLKNDKRNGNEHDISLSNLTTHFKQKLSNVGATTNLTLEAEHIVSSKLAEMKNRQSADSKCHMTLYQLKKYVNNLRSGCSSGYDSISPEHMKYAINSDKFGHHMCQCLIYVLTKEQFLMHSIREF
jgi:hypothetical protein